MKIPYRKYTAKDLACLCEVLGLDEQESSVLAAAAGIAFTLSDLSRRSGVPRGSISRIVQRLEYRRLIESNVTDGRYVTRRGTTRTVWRSNIPRIAHRLRYAAATVGVVSY